ncbi:MAG TPA: bifunctional phosphoglucose/phosphomannose isomerase [Chloroflexi bacterium]|nr:bifunctional phosphoglucose/phosphomannose isomerase [Chloroflexota bacterium]
MLNLDDVATYRELDAAGMRERMGELPRQCADAWALTEGLEFPPSYRQVGEVIILGMGGSAIGGALLASLVAGECPLPILSVRGYDLPAHVGPESLVVASSYSGNTEETLSAFTQAVERGSPLVAVVTGGRLAAIAEEKRIPLVRFDYCSQPRAALGYSFTLLLGLLCRLGLLRDYRADLEEAVAVMEERQKELSPDVPVVRNPAKRLAGQLVGRLPVVYGAGFLSPVARRWKGQFNENAKNWAFWEELPELNHNAVVGYGMPDGVRERAAVLMLRSSFDHPRVQARWEVTQELLLREGVMVDVRWGRGASPLAQMFSLIHFGDYVSLYLAVLNGADPTPVPPIDCLKRRLAQVSE